MDARGAQTISEKQINVKYEVKVDWHIKWALEHGINNLDYDSST